MESNIHKAGFVSIIGLPNAGKSTLLNELMGEKMSIVTEKAQTTRHRIFGIYNEPDVQIVFSDTPGILEPQYGLQEKMMDQMNEVFSDSDAFLYIVDINDPKALPEDISKKLNASGKPLLIALNKIDTSSPDGLTDKVQELHESFPHAEILPISALHHSNTDLILPKLKSWMEENPPFYDKDAFTNKPSRFFVNEIIREKILKNYQKEIPYSVEVVTESFKEQGDSIEIESVIYTERESQKGILLGHKGMRLSKVRNQSRKEMERFFGKDINLNLFIKIEKDWRKNDNQLKRFGY